MRCHCVEQFLDVVPPMRQACTILRFENESMCRVHEVGTKVGTQSPKRQVFYAKIPETAPRPKSCLDDALRAALELYLTWLKPNLGSINPKEVPKVQSIYAPM